MITGMLEIEKINPESRKAGRREDMMEIIKASCWDLVMTEIRSPIPNPQIRNMDVASKSRRRLPFLEKRT